MNYVEAIGFIALLIIGFGLIFSGERAIKREQKARGGYRPVQRPKVSQPHQSPPKAPEGYGAAHNKEV